MEFTLGIHAHLLEIRPTYLAKPFIIILHMRKTNGIQILPLHEDKGGRR
jgi:hypothetical protein